MSERRDLATKNVVLCDETEERQVHDLVVFDQKGGCTEEWDEAILEVTPFKFQLPLFDRAGLTETDLAHVYELLRLDLSKIESCPSTRGQQHNAQARIRTAAVGGTSSGRPSG